MCHSRPQGCFYILLAQIGVVEDNSSENNLTSTLGCTFFDRQNKWWGGVSQSRYIEFKFNRCIFCKTPQYIRNGKIIHSLLAHWQILIITNAKCMKCQNTHSLWIVTVSLRENFLVTDSFFLSLSNYKWRFYKWQFYKTEQIFRTSCWRLEIINNLAYTPFFTFITVMKSCSTFLWIREQKNNTCYIRKNITFKILLLNHTIFLVP